MLEPDIHAHIFFGIVHVKFAEYCVKQHVVDDLKRLLAESRP